MALLLQEGEANISLPQGRLDKSLGLFFFEDLPKWAEVMKNRIIIKRDKYTKVGSSAIIWLMTKIAIITKIQENKCKGSVLMSSIMFSFNWSINITDKDNKKKCKENFGDNWQRKWGL